MTRPLRLLVYGLNYAPELVGIGKYTSEMCEWLAARGHAVEVVTSHPHYPAWRVEAGHDSHRYGREDRGGVVVRRCPIYVPARPSGARRLASHASFAAASAPVLLAAARRLRPDILFTVAPSLLTVPVALAAAAASGAQTWLHIQDFEVDAAFELAMISGRLARRCAIAGERVMMRRFDRVSTISGRMIERLGQKGIEPGRTVEFRNWVDARGVPSIDRMTAYRRALDLGPEHVVALYSGSMAAKQGLEHLAVAARRLATANPAVALVFCGNGAMRGSLEASVNGLSNVRFLDLQPTERLPELLATADIHLLPQRAEVADLVLPSKLPGMLASGRPVVAMAGPGTQIAAEIVGAGLAVPPGDVGALVAAILALAADAALRRETGEAGRRAALAGWDTAAILPRMEAALSALAAERPRPAAIRAASRTGSRP